MDGLYPETNLTPISYCTSFPKYCYPLIIHAKYELGFRENNSHIILKFHYRQGLDKLYAVSYMWIPTIGIMITLVVGMIVSLITGGHE